MGGKNYVNWKLYNLFYINANDDPKTYKMQ